MNWLGRQPVALSNVTLRNNGNDAYFSTINRNGRISAPLVPVGDRSRELFLLPGDIMA